LIILVTETGLQRRCRVSRVDADHRPATSLPPGKQAGSRAIGLQAYPFDGKPRGDEPCDDLGVRWQLAFAHSLPLQSRMQIALSFIETSMPM
jgi:hypothetical protein